MTRVMKARKASVCPRCQTPVTIGQRIAKLGARWVHLSCVPVSARLRNPGKED